MITKLALSAALIALPFAAQAEPLAPAQVSFTDGSVSASLTGVAGDAATGRKVFMNRKQGNCLACHVNSDMPEQSFHGSTSIADTNARSRNSQANPS